MEKDFEALDEVAQAIAVQTMTNMTTTSALHAADIGLVCLRARLLLATYVHQISPEAYQAHLRAEKELLEDLPEIEQGATVH